jgi:hypothetical protein
VSNWSNDEVCSWLREINLGSYVDTFQNSGISGYDLLHLKESELKEELRINRFHDRSLISRAVKEMLMEQCNTWNNSSEN